jgi:hypothetical protein
MSGVAVCSAFDEGEQIVIECFGVDGQHAVAEAGIGLQRALAQQLDRQLGAIVDRHDLVVFGERRKQTSFVYLKTTDCELPRIATILL